MIIPAIDKAMYRKVTMKDVLKAQKRVMKCKNKIEHKDKYDKTGTLEAERDINSRGMRLTIDDITIILYSCSSLLNSPHLSNNKNRKLNKIMNSLEDSLNGISHKPLSLNNADIQVVKKAMKYEKQDLLKQMPTEEKKTWKRLYIKLSTYIRKQKHLKSSSNHLLQSAINLMHLGKVRKAFDKLLTNMSINHQTCRNNCSDILSRTTLNTMLYGIGDIQFNVLDDIMTGTKNHQDNPIEAKDYQIMKNFVNKGYKYSMMILDNKNEIKKN